MLRRNNLAFSNAIQMTSVEHEDQIMLWVRGAEKKYESTGLPILTSGLINTSLSIQEKALFLLRFHRL